MDRMRPSDMPEEGSVILLYLLLDRLRSIVPVSSSQYSTDQIVSSVATRRQRQVHKVPTPIYSSRPIGRLYRWINTDNAMYHCPRSIIQYRLFNGYYTT